MSTLSGKNINETYDGLLKTSDNEALPQTGRVVIQDGLGNDTALSIGRAGEGVSIDGPIEGITGGGTVTAKEFSVVSVSEYIEGVGLYVQFLIDGETCSSITAKFYMADSQLPVYTTSIDSPTNNTAYAVAGSYPFSTGNYTILFEAEFADNTKAYDISNFAYIKDDGDIGVSFINTEVRFITDPYDPNNLSKYAERLNLYYSDRQIILNRQQPASRYTPGCFFEFEITFDTTPYDHILEGAIQDASRAGQVESSYLNSDNNIHNIIPSFIEYSTPSFYQYLTEKISDSRYKIIFRIQKPEAQNKIANNPSENYVDLLFSFFQYTYGKNRLGNLVTNSFSSIVNVPLTIDLSTYTMPNHFKVRSSYFSTTTLYTAYCDLQNIDFSQGVQLEFVELYTMTTLGTNTYFYAPPNGNDFKVNLSQGFNYGVAYELRISGQYIDGTPLLVTRPVQLSSPTASVNINSFTNSSIYCTATFTNWVDNNTTGFYIESSDGSQTFASSYNLLSNDGSIGNVIVDFQRSEYYQSDLTNQDVNLVIYPTNNLTPGDYRVRLAAKDSLTTDLSNYYAYFTIS
jgi:hypothetical protein